MPWVTPADLSGYREKYIARGERNITKVGLESSSARLLPKGTVLFSSRAPVGYVAIAERPLATNQGFKSFVPPAGIASDYLYYYLQRAKPLALELASGTTFQEVSGKRAAQIPLAIAPIHEQPRIVAKLEELFSDLDAGVAALERARANLKRYRAAVLKAAVEGKLTERWRKAHPLPGRQAGDVEHASKLLERILAERRRKWEKAQLAKFAAAGKAPPKGWKDKYPEPAKPNTTDLAELPEGWCWASIDQLASQVRNGLPQKPASEPPGFPILRINAVRPMSVDLTEVRYLSKARDDVEDYFLTDGDLLFTRYNGSIDLLGVSGMVRNCEKETLHPDKLIRVRTVIVSPLPEFIEIASNVGFSRKFIQARARTTAGQTGVSGSDIKEAPIPLCPLEEQRCIIEEIETRLSTVSKSMVDIETGIDRGTRLRQSILKRAFEGKLVPQDPNDLPEARPGNWFVYALECDNGSIYIGQTQDVLERWKQHATGRGAEWTQKHPPVKLVHWEELDSVKAAVEREKQLKTGSGREWLKREYAAGRTRQAGEPASVLLERIRAVRASQTPPRAQKRRKTPA